MKILMINKFLHPNGGSETAAFGPEAEGKTASTEMLPEMFAHEGKNYYTGIATGAGIYLSHTWGNSIIDAYYDAPAYNSTAYAWTYVYSPKAQEVGAQIEFQNYSRSEQDGAAPAGEKYLLDIGISQEDIDPFRELMLTEPYADLTPAE